MAAVILEADMEPSLYRTVANEKGSLMKAESHLKEKETSFHLSNLIRKTMLRSKDDEMEGLKFIIT